MRLALVILLALLLTVPARAQEPGSDTTEAWRYYPIEIGNVWEYERLTWGTYWEFSRRSVVGDTLIDGTRYFHFLSEYFDENGELSSTATNHWRFDTLAAMVVSSEGDPIGGTWGCPFTASGPQSYCDGSWVIIESSAQATVTIGASTVQTSTKSFHCCDGAHYPGTVYYATDIGRYRDTYVYGTTTLKYARVGGMEYGEPIAVSSEPASPHPVFGLSVYPNPTRGAATLVLTVPVPQAVTIEVFDALGRRVHAEERALSGTSRLRLDGARWAPGVYVVRVVGAGGEATTTHIVKR